MKIRPVGIVLFYAERRTDGQTDRQTEATKLIVASHNSANAFKNEKNSNRRTGRHEKMI